MSPLHPVGTLLLTALFAVWGVFEARRLRRTRAVTVDDALRKAPHVLVAPLVVFVLLAGEIVLMVRPETGFSLPLFVEYWSAAIVEGVIVAGFGFTFALVVAIARLTRREDWKNILAFGVIFSTAVPVGIHVALAPIASTLGEREVDGVVLQTSPNSCAAASAATFVRLFGLRKTEREMAVLLRTTVLGTSSAHVVYGLGELGFSCRREALRDPPPTPALLMTDAGGFGHAVALLGPAEGGAFRVGDPLVGETRASMTTIRDVWKSRVIVCERAK